MAAGVTTYSVPTSGGCRMSAFEREGLRVTVVGSSDGDTERAFALACELEREACASKSAQQRIHEKDEVIDGLLSQVAAARALIPPSRCAQLFAPGYVRFHADGGMWLLGRKGRGFGAFGVLCRDWDDLFRRFNVRVTEAGEDEHGRFWTVENLPEVR